MPKLQAIKRSNGSIVHSVNIPLEFIERLSWEKGDELIVEEFMIEHKVGTFDVVGLIIKKEENQKRGD